MKKVKQILSLFFILTAAVAAFAQDIRITGTVVDQDNKPIPGANVVQKGTGNGTACNRDGKFEINLADGEHTLLIAFIGYRSYEHKVRVDRNSKINLEINLIKDERKNRKLKSSGRELRETIVLQ